MNNKFLRNFLPKKWHYNIHLQEIVRLLKVVHFFRLSSVFFPEPTFYLNISKLLTGINNNRMKMMTTIPETASSLWVVAVNKENIRSLPKEERHQKKNKPATPAIDMEDKANVNKKKSPDAFEYRIKEKKHDPL
jgi:hypothetical protein